MVLAGGENAEEQAGDPPSLLSWEQVSVRQARLAPVWWKCQRGAGSVKCHGVSMAMGTESRGAGEVRDCPAALPSSWCLVRCIAGCQPGRLGATLQSTCASSGRSFVSLAVRSCKHVPWIYHAPQVQAFAPEVLVVASLLPAAGVLAGANGAATGGGTSGTEAAAGCRALSDLSELAARPGWWQLPAVKEGRVFVADHALLCRPGPRWVRL